MNSLRTILNMIRREAVEGAEDLPVEHCVDRSSTMSKKPTPYPIQLQWVNGELRWVQPESEQNESK